MHKWFVCVCVYVDVCVWDYQYIFFSSHDFQLIDWLDIKKLSAGTKKKIWRKQTKAENHFLGKKR